MKKPLFQRIRHRLRRMRLHPIRVFVFHQVSDVFEPETMWDCDWTQIDTFKQNVLTLKKRYTFISMEEMRRRLARDKLRLKNYAVLTSDDGWASIANIIPWLAEQKIPVTLFLNPLYMDGLHRRSRETEKLLSQDEVIRIVDDYTPYVSVASHGWSHEDCATMKMEDFVDSVQKSEEVLKRMPSKVNFYAFASGRYRKEQVDYLRANNLVPVFVDGTYNDTEPLSVHRECLDKRIPK